MLGLEVEQLIPRARRACAVHDLDEPHSLLNKPPRRKQLLAKGARLVLVEAVQLFGRLGFRIEIHHAGHTGLHAISQFVGFDARLKPGVVWKTIATQSIQAVDQLKAEALLFSREVAFGLGVVERIARVDLQPNLVVRRPR